MDSKRAPKWASTWASKPTSEMSLAQLILKADLGPPNLYRPQVVHRGPLIVQPFYRDHVLILSLGGLPLWLQWLSYYLRPEMHWSPFVAWLVYLGGFTGFMAHAVQRQHRFMRLFGTFDEQNAGRDRVPDVFTNHIAFSAVMFYLIRTAMPIVLAFDPTVCPSLSWYWPLHASLWLIALDGFYYAAHRACHQVDWLWRFHAKHHGSRHPTPSLATLAGDVQEVVEQIVLPLLTSVLVPLPFTTSWLAMVYCCWVEILGHSGVRARWSAPLTGLFLEPLGLELTLEDHEVHHRYGKSSGNFGKQTRIWDWLFGTMQEREETKGISRWSR